jgi:phage terminase small subunit
MQKKSCIETFFILNDKGNEMLNPRQRHLLDLRKQFAEYSREFGFTPSSRSKIKLQEPPLPDDSEEFRL